MGRKPKSPPNEEYFTALEKNDPEKAYMKRKQIIIGRNVREHRKQRKFSVENLAEYLELSESYVGLIERGDRCPSLKIVYRLCELYGIAPNDLLEPPPETDGIMEIGETRVRYNEKRQADAILSLAKNLSPEKMDAFINFMKDFAETEKKSRS